LLGIERWLTRSCSDPDLQPTVKVKVKGGVDVQVHVDVVVDVSGI
jgi:hypothetical protein